MKYTHLLLCTICLLSPIPNKQPTCRFTKISLYSLWSTALTTCRDWWLGFPFRWRTQQSAITGMNCRITQLPNLWTQKAPGRNLPKAIPVHATSLSVDQNYPKDLKTPLWIEMKWNRVFSYWMYRLLGLIQRSAGAMRTNTWWWLISSRVSDSLRVA